MTITITNDDGETFVVHDMGPQTAAYLGHIIDPEGMPAPTPETEPEPRDAEEVLTDIVTACRIEIRDSVRDGRLTPYEASSPAWLLRNDPTEPGSANL